MIEAETMTDLIDEEIETMEISIDRETMTDLETTMETSIEAESPFLLPCHQLDTCLDMILTITDLDSEDSEDSDLIMDRLILIISDQLDMDLLLSLLILDLLHIPLTSVLLDMDLLIPLTSVLLDMALLSLLILDLLHILLTMDRLMDRITDQLILNTSDRLDMDRLSLNTTDQDLALDQDSVDSDHLLDQLDLLEWELPRSTSTRLETTTSSSSIFLDTLESTSTPSFTETSCTSLRSPLDDLTTSTSTSDLLDTPMSIDDSISLLMPSPTRSTPH